MTSQECKRQKTDEEEDSLFKKQVLEKIEQLEKEMEKKIKWRAVSEFGPLKRSELRLETYLKDETGTPVHGHQLMTNCNDRTYIADIQICEPELKKEVPDSLGYTLAGEGEKYVLFTIIPQIQTTLNFYYIGYLPMKVSEEALSDHRKLPWEEWRSMLMSTAPIASPVCNSSIWRIL